MVYEPGLGDPRFTGNQQFADPETARLCIIRGKDMV
jgi:hypothetical protein